MGDAPLDAIGRAIQVGDVCVHVSRHSSSIYMEPLIVRELTPDQEVKGDKIVYGFEKVEDEYKFVYSIRASKPIMSSRLVITGLTEAQVKAQYEL